MSPTPTQQRWTAVHEALATLRNDFAISEIHAGAVAALQKIYDAGANDMATNCIRVIDRYAPSTPDE